MSSSIPLREKWPLSQAHHFLSFLSCSSLFLSFRFRYRYHESSIPQARVAAKGIEAASHVRLDSCVDAVEVRLLVL